MQALLLLLLLLLLYCKHNGTEPSNLINRVKNFKENHSSYFDYESKDVFIQNIIELFCDTVNTKSIDNLKIADILLRYPSTSAFQHVIFEHSLYAEYQDKFLGTITHFSLQNISPCSLDREAALLSRKPIV